MISYLRGGYLKLVCNRCGKNYEVPDKVGCRTSKYCLECKEDKWIEKLSGGKVDEGSST